MKLNTLLRTSCGPCQDPADPRFAAYDARLREVLAFQFTSGETPLPQSARQTSLSDNPSKSKINHGFAVSPHDVRLVELLIFYPILLSTVKMRPTCQRVQRVS